MMHDLNRRAEISAKSLRFTVGADERRLLLQPREHIHGSQRPDKKSRFFYSWVVYHINSYYIYINIGCHSQGVHLMHSLWKSAHISSE